MNVKSIISFSSGSRAYFFYVVLPLWVGGSIYLIGRDISRLHFSEGIPVSFENLRTSLPEWIIYNLPDGLWLYGFLMWLILIWIDEQGLKSAIWYAALIILAFFSEFFQGLKLIPGTYDQKDILAYSLAVVVCFYNYFNLLKK